MRFHSLALTFLAIGLLPLNTGAATLFSTLGQNPDQVSFPGYNDTNVRLASDFTTGAQSATITGIRAAMGNPDSTEHNFQASIYSDAGGTIGSHVSTFSSALLAANTTGINNLNFYDTGTILSANTIYWLVIEMLEPTATDSPYWWLNDFDGSDTLSPISTFSTVSGSAPQSSTDGGLSYTDFSSGNFLYDIIGILAVPEPSRAILALAGFAGICFRRRR